MTTNPYFSVLLSSLLSSSFFLSSFFLSFISLRALLILYVKQHLNNDSAAER